MRSYVAALQIIVVVGLFAASGGKLGTFGAEQATFSVPGALAGAVLALMGIAIGSVFLRKRRIDETLPRRGRALLRVTAAAALATFVCAAIVFYTDAACAFTLPEITGGVAIVLVVLGAIGAFTGFREEDA